MYNYNLKFAFTYLNVEYKIKGIVRLDSGKSKVFMNLGAAGDEFPCIMIEYDKSKKVCKVSKLRAQKFGGWKDDERVVCMSPPLPSKGALDILVLLSLSIIRKYIGKVKTCINDGAMVENRYPLSWKKFWIGKGTTYSKYGFRLRETFNPMSRKSVTFNPISRNLFDFKDYMKNVRQRLNQKIKGSTFKGINALTYEKYLKYIFDKRMTQTYDPEFTTSKYCNNECVKVLKELDIRGLWYMDWDFYESLKEKVKITSIKMRDV